jgi:YVTN family beta-propeller protein
MRAALPLLRPLVAFALPLGIVACVAAVAPGSGPAAQAAGPLLWVSDEGSGDVALVDAGRGEVLTRVPVGKRPRGLRVDARRHVLYAAVSGSPGAGLDVAPAALLEPDRGADGIAAVDLVTRRLVAILPSGRDPESFDLVPGGLLVIPSAETGEATFVDAERALRVGSVAVGEEPRGVAASPDGTRVAVTSEYDGRVELVDLATRRVTARIPTCRRPGAVVFAPDGALAFVACENRAEVAVVDVAAGRPAAEIALPEDARPAALAVDREGKRLWVANGRAGTVSAVDVGARQVTATSAPFGQRVSGLAVGPDGRLYAVDGLANELVVLEARSLAVVRRIKVGVAPWGVAVAP